MGEVLKREFIIKGLHCANCAAKMENSIQNIEGVRKASIDFVGKRLVLEYGSPMDEERVINETIKTMNNIEQGVEIAEKKSGTKEIEDEKSKAKMELWKLAGALSIFAVAQIIKTPANMRLALFAAAYVLAGGKVVYKAFRNLFKGNVFDENFLMTIATIGAFAIGEYPEAAAVMIFYNIGEIFQDLAVDRSRRSIKALMNIRPDYANLVLDNTVQEVSPEDVKIGDIILVKPGERIPLDGTVIKGETSVDTSALTGESAPRSIKAGDEVLSGFIVKNKMITLRVDKEYSQSTVAKILDLVENAALKKAPTENFITKFAKVYTPLVVLTALGITLIPSMIYGFDTFPQWLYRALIFLVVSCPCALVVSIPLSFFGGIGGASKRGILVKGGNYLEALNNIHTVVFDKTGTLTEGVFKVNEIVNEEAYLTDAVLEYAATAESFSDHPIALSIKEAYGKNIDLTRVLHHEDIAGQGIKVKTDLGNILVGNDKLMEEEGITYKKIEASETLVHVAIEGNYAGYILISDKPKADAEKTVKSLRKAGVKKVAMLTGDNKATALNVKQALGLDEAYYELLPNDKVEILEKIKNEKSEKGNVVFVGDGINDAPVLTMADIGIAMGGLGSDAAIEASDIVLMTDEPSKLIEAIEIAGFTRKIVWQNIIFALGVKLVVLIMGALGLATMWEAVFADVGVAVIAVLNAMRVIKG
ncbi:MAG: heavy metal translocating P-type ATPase [Lutispora sp.]|nr:heavy metal translocating P-type ATPase [Lutispora sp.]